MSRTKRHQTTRFAVSLRALTLGLLLLVAISAPAVAGDLEFWESGASPGFPLAIAPPVSDYLLDVDYSPISAEGAGLYGMSELFLATTGDLTFTTTGFACQTFGCLYNPLPFAAGNSLALSGSDNLSGEFTTSQDLLTISVSGTLGYVAIVRGRYLDATGVVQSLGTVQDIEPIILATVPEPGFGTALATAALGLGWMGRRTAPRR